jgi:hypothetical protein
MITKGRPPIVKYPSTRRYELSGLGRQVLWKPVDDRNDALGDRSDSHP